MKKNRKGRKKYKMYTLRRKRASGNLKLYSKLVLIETGRLRGQICVRLKGRMCSD